MCPTPTRYRGGVVRDRPAKVLERPETKAVSWDRYYWWFGRVVHCGIQRRAVYPILNSTLSSGRCSVGCGALYGCSAPTLDLIRVLQGAIRQPLNRGTARLLLALQRLCLPSQSQTVLQTLVLQSPVGIAHVSINEVPRYRPCEKKTSIEGCCGASCTPSESSI